MAGGDDQPPKGQEKGTWQYRPENATADNESAAKTPVAPQDDRAVEWTASEFIVHDKSAAWYLSVVTIALLLTTIIYFFTRDIISVAAVVILGAVFVVAATRKPRIVSYRVDRGGISVGRQFHPYGNFKSFAVIDEGAFASITLLPMKRFGMPLSIYFSPEDEHKIMDVLASHLPLEPGKLDTIDRFMRNIHF